MSCWKCKFQDINKQDTLLGYSKWFFDFKLEDPKPIPPDVVDKGCSKFQAKNQNIEEKKMTTVVLNDIEQELAQRVAKERYNKARKNNRTNLKMGNQSNEETDLNGVGGEIAFCKAYNLYPPLVTGEIDTYDCVMHDGKKIDVKTTIYKTGHLLAMKTKKEGDVDAYVLVTGSMPNYTIVGCATDTELLKESNLTDKFGHGEGYGLSQEQLSPL